MAGRGLTGGPRRSERNAWAAAEVARVREGARRPARRVRVDSGLAGRRLPGRRVSLRDVDVRGEAARPWHGWHRRDPGRRGRRLHPGHGDAAVLATWW